MKPQAKPPREKLSDVSSAKTIKYFVGQGIFYVANYAYIVLLSNQLAASDFGRLSLFTAFFMLLSVPTTTIQLLLITYLAKFADSKNSIRIGSILKLARKYSLAVGCLILGAYLVAIPVMQQYFHLNTLTPFVLLVPTIILLFTSSYYKGILQGFFRFDALGVVMAAEGLAKITFALVAVWMTHSYILSLASLTFSILVSTIVAFVFVKLQHRTIALHRPLDTTLKHEMRRFLLQAGLASSALLAISQVDVIMANHVLDDAAIGTWGLLSVAGKSMIMGGGILSSIFFPSLAAKAGTNKVSAIFRKGFAAVSAFVALCVSATYFFAQPLSHIISRGDTNVAQWLFFYSLAAGMITITSYIINSQIVLKEYLFAIPSIVLTLLYAYALSVIPMNLETSMYAYFSYAAALLISSLVFYVLRYAKPHLEDFAGLFKPSYGIHHAKSSQLKILILNWRDTKHIWGGGAEVYAHELGKRWVDKGAHVTLFCGNDRHCSREEVVDGVHIIRRGGFVTVYFWAMVYYLARFRGKFDCILDCENGIPFFSALYTNTPVILLIHHVHQEIFREHLFPPFSWLAQFLESHLMPFVYRSAKIVTISDSTKKDIRRLGLKVHEVPIVYSGISLDEFKPAEKSSTPLVVYVGRLKAYKRLPDLIATARLLHQRLPQVKFVIAGDGEESGRLKKLVRLYNLESVIAFTGYISAQEKIRLYQQAWAVMNPSSMEGWSITTIEANACGTPVVAANVPGLRDSVKHRQTGLLITMGDIEGYTQALFSILTNTSLRNQLSQEAREWAESFTWEKSANRFLEIISDHAQKLNRALDSLTLSKFSR
jgi:glycosyltransferase involved in cell wall biosynthesis/O-antigen/teichoic acid export membrane protein